jgi:thiamine biosynthesis lipoprotein
MGTVVSILYDVEEGQEDESEPAIAASFAAASQHLQRIDERFSTYRHDSIISRFRVGDLAESPQDLLEVIELCAQAQQLSLGHFDPWYASEGFDPTGLVKGWALEEARIQLERHSDIPVLVNGGGDITVTKGSRWRVGIQHPFIADSIIRVTEATAALATSGTYQRENHLFSPLGLPLQTVSATVSSNQRSLAIVDALATALAVGGLDLLPHLEALEDLEAYLITATGEQAYTSNFSFLDPT